MLRRATSTIRVDENLVLRPASSLRASEIIEAYEETWPEVSRAMPWIIPDQDVDGQIREFLSETERMGRSGLLHHWVMIRPWDDYILGIIGFDRVTRSGKANWNLGYWVRSSEQQHGIASRSIEAALSWLGEVDASRSQVGVVVACTRRHVLHGTAVQPQSHSPPKATLLPGSLSSKQCAARSQWEAINTPM